MNTKEISRQLRMLDTKYDRVKKAIRDLKLEQDDEESIIETLDAQHIEQAKPLLEGKLLFEPAKVKQVDDLAEVFGDNGVNDKA